MVDNLIRPQNPLNLLWRDHRRERSGAGAGVVAYHAAAAWLTAAAIVFRTLANAVVRVSRPAVLDTQNFPNFLQSSLSLDILEHIREIPTKFHLNFGEK